MPVKKEDAMIRDASKPASRLVLTARCLECDEKFILSRQHVFLENQALSPSLMESTGQVYCPKCRFHQFLISVEKVG